MIQVRLAPADERRRRLRAIREWTYRKEGELKGLNFPVASKCHRQRSQINQHYLYPPIQASSQIRLLELEPSPCTDDPLVASFCTVNLKTPGQYEAVSHHWCDDVATDTIACDSGVLKITTSVLQALRRFRSPEKVRRLWIDLICIDQNSTTEKESQVRMMGRVYENAQATLIWLGEEDETTAKAYSIIEDVASIVSTVQRSCGQDPDFVQLHKAGFYNAHGGDWSALLQLVARGWFSRTWVLQETALAKKAILHCGGFSCNWKNLLDIGRALGFGHVWQILGVRNLSVLTRIELITRDSKTDRSLWALLEHTIGHSASDPLDKVFALLGLATDGADFMHLVDYSKKPSVLYREVFQLYLARGRTGILNQSGNTAWRGHNSTPSWLPDWASCTTFINFHTRELHHEPLRLKDARRPAISADGKALRIDGYAFDCIAGISDNLRVQRDTVAVTIRRWRTLASCKSQVYPTGESIAEALLKTLVGGADRVPTGDFTSADELLDAFLAWLDRAAFKQSADEFSPIDVKFTRYYELILIICYRRTFFRTQQGYIGLGSFFLRPGDLLVELQNGVTPFAIRPSGKKTFHVVGEALVYGKMKGQVAFAGYQVQEFELV